MTTSRWGRRSPPVETPIAWVISTSGVNRTDHPAVAQAGRDIELLRVEREPLVEPADRLEGRAWDQHAGAADPVDLPLGRAVPTIHVVPPGECIVRAHKRDKRVSHGVDDAREPAPARIDGAVGVAHHRPDEAGARVCAGHGDQIRERALEPLGVRVEEQQIRRIGQGGALVPRGREEHVRVVAHEARAGAAAMATSALPSWESLSMTTTSVARSPRCARANAGSGQPIPGVEVHDDDRQRGGRCLRHPCGEPCATSRMPTTMHPTPAHPSGGTCSSRNRIEAATMMT